MFDVQQYFDVKTFLTWEKFSTSTIFWPSVDLVLKSLSLAYPSLAFEGVSSTTVIRKACARFLRFVVLWAVTSNQFIWFIRFIRGCVSKRFFLLARGRSIAIFGLFLVAGDEAARPSKIFRFFFSASPQLSLLLCFRFPLAFEVLGG